MESFLVQLKQRCVYDLNLFIPHQSQTNSVHRFLWYIVSSILCTPHSSIAFSCTWRKILDDILFDNYNVTQILFPWLVIRVTKVTRSVWVSFIIFQGTYHTSCPHSSQSQQSCGVFWGFFDKSENSSQFTTQYYVPTTVGKTLSNNSV